MPRRSRAQALRFALVAGFVALSFSLSGCSVVGEFLGTAIPSAEQVHVLTPGDCFDNPTIAAADDAKADLPRANCTLEHDNEVFSRLELDGAKYPGEEAAEQSATDACLSEFESFIGVSVEAAGTLAYDTFQPSGHTWALGDREILCFAFDTAGKTAYSLKDAGTKPAETPAAEPATP